MISILGLPANVVYATAGVYALLVLATLVVWLMRVRNPGERYQELSDRVDSWWWMIGAFTALVLLNRTVAVVFLALISYLALKEYLSLIPTRRIDREVLLFAYLAIPIQYYWAAIDWYGMFIVFVPVWMFLFLTHAHGAQGPDGRLPARGRHLELGPDDDGVHLKPHGVAAGVGGQGERGRGRGWAPVLPGGADPVQRRRAILLGQASRPSQGHAERKPQEDLGGADRRHRHHHARRYPHWPVPHADGCALVRPCRPDPRHCRLPRRHHHVRGHGGILDRVDSLTYAAPVFVHFVRYFFYP
jgi:phosphatidate cytidylyltransferase